MNLRWIYLLLLYILPVLPLAGQTFSENDFEHYNTADGLSQNMVANVQQDQTGYVWVATAAGLNRFDGSRFVQFHSSKDSTSLSSEDLAGMAWLNKDQLAVYAAGVHIVDTRTGKTRNLYVPAPDKQFQYKYNMIAQVKGDDEGNIFVLTRSGFYHFDKNDKLLHRFDYYTEAQVPVTHFYFGREIFELDKNRLMIVSINGLYIYDIRDRSYRKMESKDSEVMSEFLNYTQVHYRFYQPNPGQFFVFTISPDTMIYVDVAANKKVYSRLPPGLSETEFHWRSTMTKANDTLFYITSHNVGFFRLTLNPKSGQVNFNPKRHFEHLLCSSILVDRDNLLWIGTPKGLYRQEPTRSVVKIKGIPPALENSYPYFRLDDLYVLGDKLFAGTRSRTGMLIFDKRTLEFKQQHVFNHRDSTGNTIYAITNVDSNTLFLGTDGPLLLFEAKGKFTRLTPPKWNPYDWTHDVFRDRNGDIWVSSRNVYKYSPKTKTFTQIPRYDRLLSVAFVIREDTSGHIWMAGHGIARYNTKLQKFDLTLDSFPYNKMPDKQVGSLVIDQNNNIWFSSSNNGLIRYSIDKKEYRQFTRSEGLPDDNVGALILVDNKLWVACTAGLACIDTRTMSIVSFGRRDGFPDLTVLRGARFYYDEESRHLFLGLTNMIVSFNPHEILKRKSPSHVFIENITLNGIKNTFLPGSSFTTNWKQNDVMITIGAINFQDGYSQGFAYRFANDEDATWQPLGNQPSFNISNLAPGKHRIQVKAYSLHNRWPEQVSEFMIVVTPPFWKETWFVLVLTGITMILLYLFIQWRTGRARKKEMEKTHVEKLKADHYKSQYELEQISNYFSSSMAGKKTEEDVLWDVTHNLIGRMNYEDCIIYLWNKDKTKMVQKAAYGPKGDPMVLGQDGFEVAPGQGIVGHVIQTRQPILVSDTRQDIRYRVDDQFRLSEVCVPIIHDDELMGVIDSEHHLPNYFSERDIKILTTIATLIGNKLKQIESEQNLEEKHRELATINEQLAEARLAALQAQMNPHFVFNALNSIKRMILDGDNDKASRYLSKFALMIRMTLNHSRDIFVTLDENIEYLKAYLEMEQLRFDDSFTYKIHTGHNIDVAETPIPSLMIQPLVENAIWHGLMQAGADKKITITFSQEENKIICTIEDNGIGIRQSEKLKEINRSQHHSVGLDNLRHRIKIMNEKYETDCSLNISDLKEMGEERNGTRVVLQFNLINT